MNVVFTSTQQQHTGITQVAVTARIQALASATDANALRQAIKDPSAKVRYAAVMHAKATRPILLLATRDAHPKIRQAARAKLMDPSNHKPFVSTSAIEKIDEKKLLDMLDDANSIVRARAAANPKATKKVMLKALADADVYVRSSVFEHKDLPSEIFEKALKDKARSVRENAIKHKDFPESMHIDILDDADVYIRCRLFIEKPNISPKVFAKVIHDQNANVRIFALRHKDCPETVIVELALTDSDPRVKSVTLMPQTLKTLSEKNRSKVLRAALASKNEALRQQAADSPYLPVSAITTLYETEKNSSVLLGIACNEKTPKEILIEMLTSGDNDKRITIPVRSVAVRNKRTPLAVVREVALNDKSSAVRLAALYHPKMNATLLKEILKHEKNSEVLKVIKQKLGNNK